MPGSYDVTVEVPEGLGVEPALTSVVVGEKEDLTGVDFEVVDLTGSIAGTVTTGLDGVSVEGLSVSALLDADGAEPVTIETASDGTYLFEGLLAGTYVVTVTTDEGLGTDPAAAEVVLGAGEDVVDVDFAVIDVTGSIAGAVSTVLEGVSAEGLTVSALLDADGAEPITTETASDGTYLFEGVAAGSYVVTVAVADGQTTDPLDVVVELEAGADVTDVNFAILEDLTGSIAGAVSTRLDGVSIEGLTVSALSDADGAEPITGVTGADGTFTIESVPAGSYTVTVEAGDGFTTFPAEVVVTVEEQGDVTGVNFQVIIGG